MDRAGGDGRHLLTSLEVALALAAARGPTDRGDGAVRTGAGRRRGRAGRVAGALRPRRPLRRGLRLHQVDPGLGPRRRAALAGPDARGGGGRPVHRPPTGHLGLRGRRHGRPARRSMVADAAARAVEFVGPARGPDQPGPGHGAPGPRPQVQHGLRRRSDRRAGRRAQPVRWARCRRTCATPLPGRGAAGPRRGLPLPPRRPAGWVDQQYLPDELVGTRYYRPGAQRAPRPGWWPAGASARPAGESVRRGPPVDDNGRR